MTTLTIAPAVNVHKELDLSEIVAANVRGLCSILQISQEVLAEKLGMAQPTVSQKHRGVRKWQLDELPKLAAVFGVSVADLVTPPAALVGWTKQNRPTGEIHQAGGVARSKGLEPPTF